MSEPKVALIWDIDGTILNTNGVGVVPMLQAASTVLNRDLKFDRKEKSGSTDIEILNSLAAPFNKSPLNYEEICIIQNEYSRGLSRALEQKPVTVIPQAREILKATESITWIENYIGTGNFYNCAQIKLRSGAMLKYFTDSSFFCCDNEHLTRTSIIKKASETIATGLKIVIGDSVRDTEVARELGIPVIAVATGQHSIDELRKLQPNHLLNLEYSPNEFFDCIRFELESYLELNQSGK